MEPLKAQIQLHYYKFDWRLLLMIHPTENGNNASPVSEAGKGPNSC
jgi:hypothetical protein